MDPQQQTGNGCTKLSPVSQVTVNSCRIAGISVDDNFVNGVSIIPNPVFDNAFITIDPEINIANASLVVYDLLGNKVLIKNQLNDHQLLFNKNNLKPGIYFLEFINAEGIRLSTRFVIQ